MSKYLVTGGAGFIGSNIVEELLLRGETVRVLDNLSTGKEENLAPFMDRIDFRKGDIRSENDVKSALKDISFVIHQAALGSVPRSLKNPGATNDVNVSGTLNILMLAKQERVKRVIYASSSSVYGNCKDFPQKESFEPRPMSPYAVSKFSAELYCRMFAETMGLETVRLRYFNVFGPRQDPASQYAAAIPTFISALNNDRPCVIHGQGSQSRDFTFISRVVEANLAACEISGISGGVFNVAFGKEHSILELSETIKKILGKQIESIHAPRRPGDMNRSLADIRRLTDILKVENDVNFYKALEQTTEWFVGNYSAAMEL